jgi:hypothetical protein
MLLHRKRSPASQYVSLALGANHILHVAVRADDLLDQPHAALRSRGRDDEGGTACRAGASDLSNQAVKETSVGLDLFSAR